MIQRCKRGVQPRVVVEDCSRAVNIRGRTEFLGDACEIDVFTVKGPVVIVKRMHVVATDAAATVENKISGAWHKRLYNFSNVLAKYPQGDIEDADQSEAYRKAGQHKLFSVLQHFSEHRVRGQIDKSATNLRHDQTEPKRRNVRQKKIADQSAEERSRFHSSYPAERGCALESGADQKAAERKAFGNLVNAKSGKQRPFCGGYRRNFALNSQC